MRRRPTSCRSRPSAASLGSPLPTRAAIARSALAVSLPRGIWIAVNISAASAARSAGRSLGGPGQRVEIGQHRRQPRALERRPVLHLQLGRPPVVTERALQIAGRLLVDREQRLGLDRARRRLAEQHLAPGQPQPYSRRASANRPCSR